MLVAGFVWLKMAALSPFAKSVFTSVSSLLRPVCGIQQTALGLKNVSTMSSAAFGLGLFRTCFLPMHQSVRTTVRNHFPKPSEYKRVSRHGYKKRMSTISGQKIIMRRILKGRFVLSH